MDNASVDLNSISRLIPACVEGDVQARNRLLAELQGYLWYLAKEQTPEALRRKVGVSDVVQLSFTRMVENLADFRGDSSQELRAWIRKIVENEVKRIRRDLSTQKRKIALEVPIESETASGARPWSNQLADANLTPSSEAIRREQIETFHAILSEMPEEHAEVIRLRSIEDLTFAEVAQRMDRSEGAASQLWYRAMVKFQDKLQKHRDLS